MSVTPVSRAVAIGVAVAIGFAPTAMPNSSFVGVSAPQYDSPGATVPAIVTAYGMPAGYSAALSARATGGASAICSGEVWINRRRRTASRKCYLRLPNRRGSYNLVGRAQLSRAGSATIIRRGVGSRPVKANGYRSAGQMSLARMQEIERCFNSTDRVWLTFDDGGRTPQVRRILDTLQRSNVRARFFFTGAWAARNPLLKKRITADGHLLGNHSYSHPPLSRSSGSAVARQIGDGVRGTGSPKLLRPPFGAGAFSTRLQSLAEANGYALCRWTTDTYDWQGVSAARMTERIRYGDWLSPPVAAGGNILMHGAGRHTSEGLSRIIRAVRSMGLTLEPLRPAAAARLVADTPKSPHRGVALVSRPWIAGVRRHGSDGLGTWSRDREDRGDVRNTPGA